MHLVIGFCNLLQIEMLYIYKLKVMINCGEPYSSHWVFLKKIMHLAKCWIEIGASRTRHLCFFRFDVMILEERRKEIDGQISYSHGWRIHHLFEQITVRQKPHNSIVVFLSAYQITKNEKHLLFVQRGKGQIQVFHLMIYWY